MQYINITMNKCLHLACTTTLAAAVSSVPSITAWHIYIPTDATLSGLIVRSLINSPSIPSPCSITVSAPL